jgi:hypothetical protein
MAGLQRPKIVVLFPGNQPLSSSGLKMTFPSALFNTKKKLEIYAPRRKRRPGCNIELTF